MLGLSTFQIKLVAGAVGAALLAGAVWQYGRARYDAGRAAGAAEQLALDEAERKAERAELEARLLDGERRLAAAEQRYQEAVALVRRLNDQLAALQAQRVAGREQVSRLADDQLFSDVRAKLGMVPPTEPPPFTAPELREIAVRVTEHPLLTRQAELLEQKVAALEAESAARTEQLKAVEAQRDAAIAAYNQITAHYVKAYNATRRRNWLLTIFTLGIKGGPQKLDIPAPVEIPRLSPPRGENE